MFFNQPGKATKLKKIIYLCAAVVLGLFLGLILHALIEVSYLHWAVSRNKSIVFYSGCALPPALQLAIWMLGAISGFFLGSFWWRKLYVERVWSKRIK